MPVEKHILIINGSASSNSSNEKLIGNLANLMNGNFNVTIFNDLKLLPHFDPELSTNNPPAIITAFRDMIERLRIEARE